MRFVLAAALVLSTVSFAQTSPAAQPKKERRTEIIFDKEDGVFGERLGPDGELIHGDSRPIFNPMIRVRDNFNDKLKASVNDLK